MRSSSPRAARRGRDASTSSASTRTLPTTGALIEHRADSHLSSAPRGGVHLRQVLRRGRATRLPASWSGRRRPASSSVAVSAEGSRDWPRSCAAGRRRPSAWTLAAPLRTPLVEVMSMRTAAAEGADIEVDDDRLADDAGDGQRPVGLRLCGRRGSRSPSPRRRRSVDRPCAARSTAGWGRTTRRRTRPRCDSGARPAGPCATLSPQAFTGDVTLPADAGKAQVIEAGRRPARRPFSSASITLVAHGVDGAGRAPRRRIAEQRQAARHLQGLPRRELSSDGCSSSCTLVVQFASPLSLELVRRGMATRRGAARFRKARPGAWRP
jgi:hypothetical protein